MICQYCHRNKVGTRANPRGYHIRNNRRKNARFITVCSPCEIIVGGANMSLAGYKQTKRGEWTK